MFESLLIANRGEIACRVIRSAQDLGIRTIAVYSEADRNGLHVDLADEAIEIGPARAADSYLRIDKLAEAVRTSGAEAVHPGYGFLSESPSFAEAVEEVGAVWVGPSPETMAQVADKRVAREVMAAAGVPVSRGGEVGDLTEARKIVDDIGFPVIVKAAAGGGGIGMRVVEHISELDEALETTALHAMRFFGDDAILLERYLPNARHVEVQVLGLGNGEISILGERDCSVQRRYQKVIEETPSPGVSSELRRRMFESIRKGAESISYRNAGTFECLVSGDEFFFLEVNARLQVEHPVTEMVTGVDLVEEQLRVAAGESPGFDPDRVDFTGHAIEMRVYAEDPIRFLPRPGTVTSWQEPHGPGVRVDSGIRAGQEVTPFYDPLLAKLIVHGRDRADAIMRAERALAKFVVDGIQTNLPFLEEVLQDEQFRRGRYDTSIVSRLRA